MIDIRIVCAHDAAETAEAIKRLLQAEQHKVDICTGRPSAHFIEASRARREAVLLIWTPRATGAHYMLQWAEAIDPELLAEIALEHAWPPLDGRAAPVIDFRGWRGARGSAWSALHHRLQAIARASEPPKPQPLRAALVLAGVGVAAASAAVWARMDADHAPLMPAAETRIALETQAFSTEAQGGPVRTIEPASFEPDRPIRFRAMLDHIELIDVRPLDPPEFDAARHPPPTLPAADEERS